MKCGELAKEFEVTSMRIGKVRRQLFPHGRGELNGDEVKVVREFLNRQMPTDNEEKDVEPDIINCVVTFAQKGRRIVECIEKGAAGRFPVLLPFGVDGLAYLKKTIKVERIYEDGKPRYRHAALARKRWEFRG
jgi:hypothetical protein